MSHRKFKKNIIFQPSQQQYIYIVMEFIEWEMKIFIAEKFPIIFKIKKYSSSSFYYKQIDKQHINFSNTNFF